MEIQEQQEDLLTQVASLEADNHIIKKKLQHFGETEIQDQKDKDEIADSFVELGQAVKSLEANIKIKWTELQLNAKETEERFSLEIRSNIAMLSTKLQDEAEQLAAKVEKLENKDRTENEVVDSLSAGLEQVQAELAEYQLSKRNNLLFHGLAKRHDEEEETQALLVERVMKLMQWRLGIARALPITGVTRVPWGPPILGSPPVLVTFLNFWHKEEVLRRARMSSGDSWLLVTEDLPRHVINSWRPPSWTSLGTGAPSSLPSCPPERSRSRRVKERRSSSCPGRLESPVQSSPLKNLQAACNVHKT